MHRYPISARALTYIEATIKRSTLGALDIASIVPNSVVGFEPKLPLRESRHRAVRRAFSGPTEVGPLRWSLEFGQFAGLVKLGPGCRQAANRIMSLTPYASSGVRPPSPLWGRSAL
jgi:hypothetical protein